jgi:transposase-like protein
MKDTFKPLYEAFNSLSKEEKAQFAQMVFKQMSNDLSLDSLNGEVQSTLRKQCPHCQGGSIFANGKAKGMQRYGCKDCKKNFSESTGTALASIHKKDLWISYIINMFEGHSLRKCAELTGISLQTSFDWRHKILSRLRHEAPEKFSGICELDDISFNFSEKGSRNLDREPRKRGNSGIKQGGSNDKVAVLLSADRSNKKDFQVIKRGRVRKADLQKAIGARIEKNTVICCDSHRSFTGFAKENDLEIKKIVVRKGQHVVDKVYHVQHVNQMAQALRKWMANFNGVASKYLQNYMNWYLMIEKLKANTAPVKAFALAILAAPVCSNHTLDNILNHA